MNEDMLEILIGKYIDSEITPAEQVLLDEELEKNPAAGKLLAEMENLRRQCQDVLTIDILKAGCSFDEIFEKAWHKRQRSFPRLHTLRNVMRFAAGIAAGMIIGFAVFYYMNSSPSRQVLQTEPPAAPATRLATNDIPAEQKAALAEAQPQKRMIPRPHSSHNIEWYSIRDRSGDEWLIEGYRQNNVENAVYHGDL